MIRKAEMKDMRDYYGLICSLEETIFDEDRFAVNYRKILENPMYELYIWEENNECIGIMTLFYSLKLHHNGLTGEILELIIRDDYRNNGIGKEMLKAAFEAASRRNCLEIELSSSMRRIDAHRFYEKAGFRKDHYNFTLPLK